MAYVGLTLTTLGLCLLPALTALDLGGVRPRLWPTIAMGLIAAVPLSAGFNAILLPRARRTGYSVVLIAMVAAACMLTTVELPISVVQRLSPGSAAIYGRAAELMSGGEQLSRFCPISVTPFLTQRFVARWVVIGAAFFVASQCFRHRRLCSLGLSVLALPALVQSVLGIVMLASPEVASSLSQAPVVGSNSFATFVNRNIGGLLINLSTAAAIGVLVYRIRRANAIFGDRHPAGFKRTLWLSDRWAWASMVVILLSLLATFVAGSRGALAAWGFGLVAMLLISVPWRMIPKVGAGVAALALVCLAALSTSVVPARTLDRLREPAAETDTVADPIATLQNNIRMKVFRDALETARAHLPLGSGMGTYRFASLPFANDGGTRWAAHADNVFLEWFAEAGLLALAVYAFAAIVMVRRLRELTHSADPLDGGLLASGSFAIATACVSQSLNFGVAQMPNAVLVAALAALIDRRGSLAELSRRDGRGAKSGNHLGKNEVARPEDVAIEPFLGEHASWAQRRWSVLYPLILLLMLIPALVFLQRDAEADRVLRAADFALVAIRSRADSTGVIEALRRHENLVEEAANSLGKHPALPLMHAALRSHRISRQAAEHYRRLMGVDDQQALSMAELRGRRMFYYDAIGRKRQPRFGLIDQRSITAWRAIAPAVRRAVRLNPHNDLGWFQLCRLDFADEQTSRIDARLAFLRQYDGRTAEHLRLAAEVAIEANRFSRATDFLRRAVRTDSAAVDAVVRQIHGTPIRLSDLLPLPADRLLTLASAGSRQSDPDPRLLRDAVTLLRDRLRSTAEDDLLRRLERQLAAVDDR